jgi:rubredoxin
MRKNLVEVFARVRVNLRLLKGKIAGKRAGWRTGKESNSDSFVSANLYFEVMPKAVCPRCESREKVRKILWGMPSEDVDLDEYFIGGCVMDPNPARYICIACDYEFGARQQSRFIMDSLEGITITCGVCKLEYPASEPGAHSCK